jgi:hypothetical protein
VLCIKMIYERASANQQQQPSLLVLSKCKSTKKEKKPTNTFFMKTNSGFTEVQKNIPFSQLEQFHVEFVLLCEKEVLQKKERSFLQMQHAHRNFLAKKKELILH